jgi:uncharacterized membrane protein YfcA
MYVLVPLVALAFAVEAAVGFGGMVITLAVGTIVLPIDEILPRVVPVNLVLAVALAARHGHNAERAYLVRRVLPWVVLAMPLGLLAFAYLDRRMLTFVFGLFVLVLALFELRKRPDDASPVAALGPRTRTLFLLASGFMQGAFSTGGPMLVYVVAREVPLKARFRATLAVAWVVLAGILVVTYAVSGRIDAHTMSDSLMLALSLGIGLVLGEWVHTRIEEAAFKRVVYVMLAISAVFLLVRSALT